MIIPGSPLGDMGILYDFLVSKSVVGKLDVIRPRIFLVQ